MEALTLKINKALALTASQFEQLAADNPDWQLELTAKGDLIIMPPTGGETGARNDEISFQLFQWNKQTGLGKTFNAATGFQLPNGATRSPDASWVSLGRWSALTPQQKATFPPLCPDFVVELRSPTDTIAQLKEKMEEYIANGAKLGWLIDPKNKTVTVYKPNQQPIALQVPLSISGEDVLPGFVLDLKPVWD